MTNRFEQFEFRRVWPSKRVRLAIVVWILGVALSGCSAGQRRSFEDEVITVACGRCVFEMEGVGGCPWAAEIDGKHYLIVGNVPEDHVSHDPDGICNMPRKAVIRGELRGDTLVVSSMILQPASDVPAQPHFTPADQH